MTEVHFVANAWKAKNKRARLEACLVGSPTHGEQIAITEIASDVSASLAFLATHYGIDQARRIWSEATEAGFTHLENEDYDRQQRERADAFSDLDHGKRRG